MLIKSIESKIRKQLFMRKKKLEITRKFKFLENHRRLTKEQKKEIQDFYLDAIGKKVPLYMHEYFYSRNGIFSKYYIPSTLYLCELLPKANNYAMSSFYSDKNFYELLFPGENIVHSFLKNINGYYYYEDEPVSEEEAILRCQNMQEVIIKPSRESKGTGVQLISVKDGITDKEGKTVAKMFKEYKKNFLIQNRVRQHKDMAALNPTSLNTLRILTYRSGMEILLVYSVVRIGRLNQVIDNQSAGGLSTTIDSEGKLGKFSFGKVGSDNIEKTDTGITLEGYQVPSYDTAIEFVKRLHFRLPFFHIIGWDVAIEENGEPILVEFNTKPGLSQSAYGSGMGKYTERIIRELWPRPNTRFPE